MRVAHVVNKLATDGSVDGALANTIKVVISWSLV